MNDERLRFDQVLDPFEHLLTLRANISAHIIIIIIIIIIMLTKFKELMNLTTVIA